MPPDDPFASDCISSLEKDGWSCLTLIRRTACFAEKPLIILQRILLSERRQVASQILPGPGPAPDNRYALPVKSRALRLTVGFDFSGCNSCKSHMVFHNFSTQGYLNDEVF